MQRPLGSLKEGVFYPGVYRGQNSHQLGAPDCLPCLGQDLLGHAQREQCQGAQPRPSLCPLPWEAVPALHSQGKQPHPGAPATQAWVLVPREASIVSWILDVAKGEGAV